LFLRSFDKEETAHIDDEFVKAFSEADAQYSLSRERCVGRQSCECFQKPLLISLLLRYKIIELPVYPKENQTLKKNIRFLFRNFILVFNTRILYKSNGTGTYCNMHSVLNWYRNLFFRLLYSTDTGYTYAVGFEIRVSHFAKQINTGISEFFWGLVIC
jgi:hypothetical protein